jgi:hypothetical protein
MLTAVGINWRRLSSGVSTALEPATSVGDRWNQLDVGVTKKVRVRKWDMEYSAMVFNSLNASPVLTYNTAFGSSLDRPLSNLQPRLLRVSMRAAF